MNNIFQLFYNLIISQLTGPYTTELDCHILFNKSLYIFYHIPGIEVNKDNCFAVDMVNTSKSLSLSLQIVFSIQINLITIPKKCTT